MIQKLIKEHVNKLTVSDIDKFAKENNIFLTDSELNDILVIVKNNWYELAYGNSDVIFSNNRNIVDEENYDKIKELFDLFKKKYQRFL